MAHSWQGRRGGERENERGYTESERRDVWDALDERRSEQNDYYVQRKCGVRCEDTRIPDVLHERIRMWGWGKEMRVEGHTRRLWGSPWRRS